jgi:formamidopyrimidine-DNA glycosylase
MPELPDVTVYIECLRPRVVDQPLERARIASPFLLRSVDPPVAAVEGKTVRSVERLGKRIVLGTDDDLFLVLHLMIAGGRCRGSTAWRRSTSRPARCS